MKPRYLLIIFCLLTALAGHTQNVGINADGSAPDSSAILDVKSVNKGVLVPRLTQQQIGAIPKPAVGLLVYQQDNTPGFYYYTGTKWSAVSDNLVTANNKLIFSGNDTGFIATFENKNTTTGDGLEIKLGKYHPQWNISSGKFPTPIDLPNVQYIHTVKEELTDLIVNKSVNTSPDMLISLWPNSMFAGDVIELTNMVTQKLDKDLKLPIKIGPYGTKKKDLGIVTIPALDVVPRITVVPSIPQIPNPFPFMSFPNIDYSIFNVGVDSRVLSNENQFIKFADKDDRQLGEIRAEAVQEWRTNCFNDIFIAHVIASLVGIDLAKDALSIEANMADLAYAYNHIGVEYLSGSGDYAEWLQRSDENEVIAAGDIVAVKGGKITKNLSGAEQVMVASYRPIVLGNIPTAGKENLGNNVAFMGQVPVKVMGGVNTGDYIVAKSNIPGYGVAVNPAKMTVADYKMCVGRSWEQNLTSGPKVVNTIVGIDNGNYVKILQNNQKQINETQQQLQDVNARLMVLEAALKQVKPKTTLQTKLN